MSVELLQKLFKYRKTVEINGVTLYMRVIGDQVVEDARKAALLESRKLRKELRDVDSDAYLLHLDGLNDLSLEELTGTVILQSSRDIMREYLQRTPRPQLDPLPEYPTQEQQEEYEAAKTARDEAYVTDMQAYVESWRKEYTEGLRDRPIEQLRQMTMRHQTDRVCEELFTKEFEDRVLIHAIFSDKDYKKRAFTLEEFRDLPIEIKRKLRDEYDTITIGGDDLKN